MIYLDETYDQLISKSYDYDKEMQNSCLSWGVVQRLYQNNYIGSVYSSTPLVAKIPKKIHQIWLGEELPEEYKKYGETWKEYHPDWEYKLWTDVDVNDVDIPRRSLYDSITNVAQKSDFLRYHILNQFGGLYVDTDFECIKPFDDLLYLDFFTGIGYPKKLELYIGLIASVPKHPIINHLINHLTTARYGGSWRKMFNTTGSYFFTKMFLKKVKADTRGVVAFPTDFFYPYPNNFVRKDPDVDPYSYIRLCSYAIHHWAVSWRKKK